MLLLSVGDRVRLVAPAGTVVLHDRAGRFLGEPGTTRRLGFWPVDPQALPGRVVAATLVIEDHRFWDHPGVDPIGVGRAIAQNLRAGRRISGASTIAMQVARLQDPARRTWPNKLLEAATALRLVHRYGHATVLAQYLRLAPYGNNVHGIGYAARRYFDKPVDDLSWAEVAFLTALPQAPGLMNPYRAAGRDRARARAHRILDLLLAAGRIDRLNHGQALIELASLDVMPRPTRPDATLHPLFAFERQLGTLRPTLGTDLRVQSTLDLPLQASVQARLAAALEGFRADGAGQIAAVVVDIADGYAVRAAVGSADWHGDTGALDFTRVRRASGSTLKPFLYALALERGAITPATPLDDLARAGDGIGNNDGRFLGPLLPRAALGNSRNVPAVELLERVGAGSFHALLGELGLHQQPFMSRHGLGIAIGGLPVRLVDLVRAYATLAGDGTLPALRWYRRQPQAPARRVFEATTAAELRLWLSDPMARLPTFPRGGHLEHGFPVAIKTGTTGDYRDAWAVAFSDRYLVGVWVGHPAWKPMRRLSGYRVAAVVREIMRELHPEALGGLADIGFAPPEGWQPARICALSGQRATPACEATIEEHFAPGTAPEPDCEAHVSLPVDATGASPPEAAMAPMAPMASTAAAPSSTCPRPLPPNGCAAPAANPRPAAPPPTPACSRCAPPDPHRHPRPGTQVIRDPDAPRRGEHPAPASHRRPAMVAQVVWYVDGEAVAVADAPYVSRWPLEPGAHWIEARRTYSDVRSAPVRVVAR
ncbi:MAG: transglycosylase domain-containing protein [bacterium]